MVRGQIAPAGQTNLETENLMTQTLNRLPVVAARLGLGSIFVLFGANGFFGFLPAPSVGPEAGAFLGGLAASGYFFPLLKGTEIVAGGLLLANRAVPLALVLLAPIVINIAAFHLWLDPGLPMVALLVGLEGYLAWALRDSFRPLFARAGSLANAPALAPGSRSPVVS
jgi:hypothetical protein